MSDDRYRYKMDYTSQGICLIINNKNFLKETGMSSRQGTDIDAEKVKETFSDLGYEIRRYNDQTTGQMLNLMKRVSEEDHSKYASFVCVLLSHGAKEVICGTDGAVKFDDLRNYFKRDHCETLEGKPKLFFIQACRGSRMGQEPQSDSYTPRQPRQSAATSEETTEQIPLEANFLYGYSTAPGYVSWRDPTQGTWFIQALCKMLQRYGGRLELMQIMTRVNNKVSHRVAHNQIPSVVSMLTKDLYFRRRR